MAIIMENTVISSLSSVFGGTFPHTQKYWILRYVAINNMIFKSAQYRSAQSGGLTWAITGDLRHEKGM